MPWFTILITTVVVSIFWILFAARNYTKILRAKRFLDDLGDKVSSETKEAVDSIKNKL